MKWLFTQLHKLTGDVDIAFGIISGTSILIIIGLMILRYYL